MDDALLTACIRSYHRKTG